MIEINLLPGSAKRSRRRAGGGLPGKLKGAKLPEFDRLMAFAVAMWLVVPALTLWMFLGQRSTLADLQAQYDGAVQDSINLSAVYAQVQVLDSIRRDVADRVAVIETIDEARYNWAHLMDEISRAVPDYLWLDNVQDITGGADPMQPSMSIAGKAANMFAVTAFMNNLSASYFIGDVRFIGTDQMLDNEKLVYSFTVEADYSAPPPDVITLESILTVEGGL
ncbi:MAG: PilN domain-containing protein [Gemmatimonadota bacterium]